MAKKKKIKKKKKPAPKRKKTVKAKKAKKKLFKKKKVKKAKPAKKAKLKPVKNKKVKPEKEIKVKASKKEEAVEEQTPATPHQPTANEAAAARAKARAIARAKLKFKEKERLNTPAQATDQKAFDKQMKLAEPKHKLMLEYIIHASLSLLYDFITSPSGLSEWFADDVNIAGSTYSFLWEGSRQEARLLSIKENKSVRFQWSDRPANSYFEFRIEKNELTEELSLIITDFAETQDEMNSLEVLWQGQIQRLMKVIGSKV